MEGNVHLVPKATAYFLVLQQFFLSSKAEYRNLIGFTVKYKFQAIFVAKGLGKAQILEHIIFSKGTSRFFKLEFLAIFWSSATSDSDVMENVLNTMEGNI